MTIAAVPPPPMHARTTPLQRTHIGRATNALRSGDAAWDSHATRTIEGRSPPRIAYPLHNLAKKPSGMELGASCSYQVPHTSGFVCCNARGEAGSFCNLYLSNQALDKQSQGLYMKSQGL